MAAQKSTENEFDVQVIPLLNRMALALERMADLASRQHTSGPANASRQSQAIAWVASTGITDLRAIAKRFGVDARTVRRWTQLRSLIDGLQAQARVAERRNGYRCDGGVEAFDFDSDER